ncbi:MAG TPA: aminopeptidase [Candidatus Woesearchaeota archaeon]|nr:aminopeptidase [Candidatus Woesearchaeota archaeon]
MESKKSVKRKVKSTANKSDGEWTKKSGWLCIDEKEKKRIFDFSKGYKEFLNSSKTEREAVNTILFRAKKAGFKELSSFNHLKKGDKVYYDYKGKALILAVIGDKPSFNIIGAHIDSPRLDIKPFPLTQDCELGLFKTHYYGGIKKYQWVNRPLAMHGVALKKDGSKIEFSLGEREDEEVFIISDLLPHLSSKQLDKKADKVIEGENLQVIVGNIPIDLDNSKAIRRNVLKILTKRYGLCEEDLCVSEICFVPNDKARDLGFDRSMICGYGQDDRICAYSSLVALLDSKVSQRINVALFVDKEEIGSVGNTSAQSAFIVHFADKVCALMGSKITGAQALFESEGISADVTGAIDPIYKEVHDSENASFIGRGVSIEKSGGAGGKYYSNDSNSEYFNKLRIIFNKNKVLWQTGELGKVDEGGGGTIAMILAKHGIDIIDMGPPLLGMHSPCEISSKFDLYQTYKGYKVFYDENK